MRDLLKWIALILIFLNLGYWVWETNRVDKTIPKVAQKNAQLEGKMLVLLDEVKTNPENKNAVLLLDQKKPELEVVLIPESKGDNALADELALAKSSPVREGDELKEVSQKKASQNDVEQEEIIQEKPELELLTSAELEEQLESTVELEEPKLAPQPMIALCPKVGPFFSQVQVNSVLEKLKLIGVTANVKTEFGISEEKFRVYIEPLSSREEALAVLKKLRAKKVDSYILSDSPLNNAISLGVFSTKASAELMVKKMQSESYSAKIFAQNSRSEQFWLDVTKNTAPEKLDQTLISTMSEIKDLTRVDSPCKAIALTQ